MLIITINLRIINYYLIRINNILIKNRIEIIYCSTSLSFIHDGISVINVIWRD
jgi:hypothetical protein